MLRSKEAVQRKASRAYDFYRRVRLEFAVWLGGLSARAYRSTGRGGAGTVAGRVVLALEPAALRLLTLGKNVVLVSGTNGKTTTTHLIAAALAPAGRVASNRTGANMPAGFVTAILQNRRADHVVLEVDERYLPSMYAQVAPRVVVLLNLSRDQLDRNPEAALVAESWRTMLANASATIVANCDDPLIYWAASGASDVVWLSGGGGWPHDSWWCPSCGSSLRRPAETHWFCRSCCLERPFPHWVLKEHCVTSLQTGESYDLDLNLPGEVNYSNAVMTLAAGAVFGLPLPLMASRIERVRSVAGRYEVVSYQGCELRLLLAKNPASWAEMLETADAPSILIMLNARALDGMDTSWIWDVEFDRLNGQRIFVGGDRRLDMALRLDIAGVEFRLVPSLAEACRLASGRLDVVANYTAFLDIISGIRKRATEPHV